MMNPLDKLDFTLHAPVDWNTKLSDFNELNDVHERAAGRRGRRAGALLLRPRRRVRGRPRRRRWQGATASRRAARSATPGSACPRACRSTSTSRARPSCTRSATRRAAITSYCNGEEGGPDYSYPTYPDQGQTHGEIHDWGFGVINFKLYHPTRAQGLHDLLPPGVGLELGLEQGLSDHQDAQLLGRTPASRSPTTARSARSSSARSTPTATSRGSACRATSTPRTSARCTASSSRSTARPCASRRHT